MSASDIADINSFDQNHRVLRGQVINVPVNKAVVDLALNNKPVVYTVKAGDTLTSIAANFNITQAEIAQANNIRMTTLVRTGQRLTIPAASGTVNTSRSSATSNNVTNTDTRNTPATTSQYRGATTSYVVQSGDSLNGLSAKYGISAAQLASLNNMRANAQLRRGETIKVPKTTTTYRVRSGDTWISLANRYGISAKELADMNKLSTNALLRTGQTLTVPVK